MHRTGGQHQNFAAKVKEILNEKMASTRKIKIES